MNYDPNITYGPNEQKVLLTFQHWNYTKTIETKVLGNCSGLEVINAAIGNVYDELGDSIVLTDDKGEELQVYDVEDECETFLAKMLVKAEIVSLEEKTWEDM